MTYKVIPLGEILNEEYNKDKLNRSFQKFSCQREIDLENFLQDKAILYEKTGLGKTFLLLDSDQLASKNFVIAAYIKKQILMLTGIILSNLRNII